MPDDKTGPPETNEDQAKGAETSKAEPSNTGPGVEARPALRAHEQASGDARFTQ